MPRSTYGSTLWPTTSRRSGKTSARLDAKTDALAGDLARLDAKTDALAEDLARLDAKTDARFDGMANDILAVKEDVVWIRQKLGSNDLS